MKSRILIVDDMEMWREILRDTFEQTYSVDTADSLTEALQLLGKPEQYQVLITDIGLSDNENNTEGLDVLRAAHRLSPSTVAIAITGRPTIADKETFKKEYHVLEYLDRGDLVEDLDAFIRLVDTSAAYSLELENRGRNDCYDSDKGTDC